MVISFGSIQFMQHLRLTDTGGCIRVSVILCLWTSNCSWGGKFQAKQCRRVSHEWESMDEDDSKCLHQKKL